MADSPILMPYPRRREQNMMNAISSEDGFPNGNSNTFLPRSFVKLSSGNIVAVVTGDIQAFGFVLDASITTAQAALKSPYYRFGDAHWPLSLVGMHFLINISDNSGNVGQANGAPQLSEVVVGGTYGIVRPTSGDYEQYQMLNVDDTTNTLFRVIDIPDDALGNAQTSTTYNGFVLVAVIDDKITSI